jgi:hypothetical protein
MPVSVALLLFSFRLDPSTEMSPASYSAANGGDATLLGPLGHLPPPNLSNPIPNPILNSSPTTLLAPASITDTIVDVSPFIPFVLDLQQHNYYCLLYYIN